MWTGSKNSKLKGSCLRLKKSTQTKNNKYCTISSLKQYHFITFRGISGPVLCNLDKNALVFMI